MRRKPPTKPQMGEVTIGSTTFQSTPLPVHQWILPGMDQTMTPQLLFVAARHAPQRPPTSACEELAGKPTHQVIRLQAMAASRAQMRISEVTIFGSTRPEAMVCA